MNKHLLSNVHALAIGRLRNVERGVQPDGSSLLVWPVVDGGRWLGLDAQRLAADGQPVAPVQVLLRAPLPEPAALALKVAATSDGGFAVSWRGAADANGGVHRLSLDAAAQPVVDGAEVGDATRTAAPGSVAGGAAIDSMALAGAQPTALGGKDAAGGRDTGVVTKIPDAPLSAGPLPTPLAHGEERINAYTTSTQDNPEVAALANGRYVVVWDSAGQDGSGTGIYAQLFESNGRAVGPEWRVSGRTLGEQDYPQVVGLSDGGFVVVWEDNQGVDGAGWSVQAQRYDANGVPQGSAFTVNTTTAGNQYHGVAAAFDGGFAVTYASDSGGTDVYLKVYDNAGTVTMAETRVSTVPGQPGTAQSGTQYLPDITADAAGNLVIVWHDQSANDGSGYGVFGRRWDATTAQFSSTFVVNSTTSGSQSYPDQNYRPQVSMLNDGGFVVVWTSDSNDGSGWGVVGQRFDATTAKVGGEFLVNNSTSSSQYMPTVTGQSTGGFTVAWFNDGSTTGTSNDVLIREYDANGVALGPEVKLISDSNSTEYQPSIADLGNGNFVVVYADYDNAAGGNNTYEIAQQLFGSGPALQRGGTPVLADFGGTVTFGENAVNGAPQVIDPVVSLTHTASADFDGGFLDLFYLQGGETTDQLGVRHVGNGAGQIGVSGSTVSFGGVAFATISGGGNGSNLVISFQAGASVDAVEALIENLTYASTSSSPAASRQLALRISDGDGGSTEAAEVTIQVTPELDGAPVVHADVQVNAYAAGDQTEPAIAVLTDGSYVIAWQSNGQDGNGWGIYLQRFAANGEPIGPELRANAQTTSNQELPQIAALSDGGYVLVWQDQGGLDGSSWSVVGQRYSADGTPQGANFIVNTTTSGGQYHPSVAAYDGGFAVAWASDQGNDDIYLKRYDNAGNTVLGETLVSTVVGDPGTAQAGTQYYPDIVAKANGDLVIVWHDSGSNDGSSYGVYGRLWNAGTQTFSDAFLVNTTTTGQQSYPNDDHPPKVALLAGGGFVVVWSSNSNDDAGWAVMGQRFDAAGNKVGAEFRVNETVSGSQYQADVIGLSTGGFVVSFFNDNYDLTGAGTYNDPYIREYDAAGNAIDGQRKLATPTATGSNTEYQPALADLGNGNFVVAYADHVPTADGGNATYEITQQIFGSGSGLARSASPTIGDFSGSITVGENAANAALQAIDSSVSISDADSTNFDGGRLDLFYVQGGRASDQLGVRHQGNGPGQIGVAGNTVSFGGVAIGTISGGANGANLVISFNANADALAVEALVESLGYGTTSVSPQPTRTVALRLSDGDGGTSAASTVTINVTPERDGAPEAHSPERVNTYTPGTQEDPEIAVLADGSYVVTWTSNGQDGSGDGVYFQRFAANGTAVGAEVRANTSTASAQNYPHAAALSDGGFVLVWQDNSGVDGSGYAVMAQRYAADGTAQGINFAVNTTTSSNQYHGTVAGYDGGFAVVWSSTGNAGGSSYDIYLKRFDNSGTVVLAETRLSTVPNQPGTAQTGTQELPSIASDAAGNLVVVWQDTGSNDGNGYGVYARTVAANGTLGNTILVNSITAGNQYEPDVAMLAGGGFVVVWGDSSGVDGSSWGVFGQRFDAAGNKVGAEFLVNETTAGGQYQATVTALSTGGFVVGFYNDNYDTSGAGSYNDVYIREYDAAGNAIDGQRKLSGVTATGSNQEYQPAIADLGNGNFVVAYADYVPTADGGNATFEITQQLFGSGPALARQANPVLGDFGGTVVFAENTINSTPQVLDASVSLTDVDSADFAGGQLSLFYIQGGQASDQLGVRHQGSGAGQIGVSGNTVSFGGVAIGTLGGGMNGANLVISFNANASVDAVEALVQNLTYASTSSSPQPSRTAALRITDGDGGVTQASQITIQVTGELDGAAISHGPEQVNSHTPGAQDDPEIAVLANGSYVITWTSNGQDGSGDGVYFQRFAANGTALGAEVRANTSTTNTQNYPHAAALSDGGFVLVWQDSNGFDSSGWGVVAQRYAADGTPQGANFVVNTHTSGTQYHGTVAGYDGGFAVVWSSTSNAGGSSYDVYLKRFDNAGNEVLAETRLSTAPGQPGTAQTGTQELPSIASDAAGNLVVVWQDTGSNDGNGYGVYARTVAANGTLGNTILVNSITTGNQYEPDVAMLAGGGFVVVWGDSSGVDGASWGVYGQRFDAAGNKVGAEFLVNETTAGGQYQATVTALSTGGFVVGFYNDNYDTSGAGTQDDVYIREYDAAGNAIDGQRKLASPSNSTESQPAIADLGNGNFVVAYADYNNAAGGNNTYEINQQLFGTGPSLDRNAPPVIGDVMATRLLSSTAASPVYAANAQRIDGDVSLTDADSSNFDGGQLLVSLTNGATPTETLGVLDQGNGAGQIGVTGAEVRFGGTVIGMISGGGAGGSSLVVTLNASASAAAVRALIESVTYQNSSPPAGTTDRGVSFRLTDGDGGVSAPASLVLRIQATVTPQTVALDDVTTSLPITESQAQAGVLVDDAVQLVYSGATGFTNGKLTVSYLSSTGRPADQLAITNEGTGDGQVGVSGTDVSFGGVVIGSISASLNGVNGTSLEITFNASATPDVVEQVIEALRYANTSDGPLANRSIRISLTDGAGQASTNRDVQISITPEADPAAAVALTGDLQANTYEAGSQANNAVGRLQGPNDGSYVIVWESQNDQDGSGYSVQAQRFAANGQALGAEIRVNSYTYSTQNDPAVDGLNDGGFVVAWASNGQDGSSNGVYAQRYDANGQEVGGEFRVNTTTTSSQNEAAVLALADGGFLIAYSSDYSNTAGNYTYDVLAQRYGADGLPVGGEITLNTNLTATQGEPQLARLTGGGFVATWQDSSGADGNGWGIIAQRYAADGSKLGAEIVVNTTITGTQESPDVAGLSNGGFVVAWHYSNATYVQVLDASGAKVGPEIRVSDSDAPANYNSYARVTALDDGGFVVAWDSSSTTALGGSGYDIVAQQFDNAGNRIDGPFIVNTVRTSTQIEPDLVGLAGSNFVVSWSSYDNERGTANTYGIFHQVRGAEGSVLSSAAPVLADVVASVTFDENVVNAAPQIIDAGVGLSDADSANFDGGHLWVSVISSYPDNNQIQVGGDLREQDQLSILHQGNGVGQVGMSGSTVSYGGVAIGSIVLGGADGSDLVVQFNAQATSAAVEAVIERLAYANTSSDPGATRSISISVSDGDGATSIPRVVTVNVTPQADGVQALFGNEQVNTYQPNTQDEPAGTGLSDGSYVIVWASEGQDGNSTGVHGQRFSAVGERLGAEFEVNSQTLGTQNNPAVASLTGGGFVVVWQSNGQDGSGWGTYAQRFANDGTPLGGEVRVNTSTDSSQYQPVVTGTADGGYVVAWYDDYYNADFTELGDIYFQRFDASGVAVGPETQGNTAGLGNNYQYEPAIAGLAGGGFVLLWRDDAGDGSSSAVRGQVFNAAGVAQGSAFLANTYTNGGQYQPDVAALQGGGFVATWYSDSQDGSSGGAYAQRFDAAGNKLGDEFRVHTDNQGQQSAPSVTALDGGGFAISWYDAGRTQVQQFEADGTRIDGNTLVDTRDNNGNSAASDVFGLQGGGFVVAFQDYDYSTNNYNVYQQIFGNPALMQRQAAPVLGDVDTLVSFDESDVNAGLQRIDASIDVSDADSANFDGGQLIVSVLSGYGDISYAQLPQQVRSQDQFGIINDGNGPAQVGVSGNELRYGGVLVGTISGGVDGADLVVTFNANATEAVVEAVVENLGYGNSSSAPVASRLVSISLSDGDGGTGVPRVVQIDVTPQADGPAPVFGNEVVNTFAPGTQSEPAVTALADGGYVVTWTSADQDGWDNGVHAQRFDANGVAVGSEFKVNTYTPYSQQTPSVTGLADGGWMIAWQSYIQDGSGWGVYGQRFDANGLPQGGELLLASGTGNDQTQVDVASFAGGGFVATWYSYYQDGEYYGVYAQRFDANGARIGPEFKVDSDGAANNTYQAEPAVATFADGSFVIVYRSDGPDGNGAGVFGQRFADDGVRVGNEFAINTYVTSSQYQPDVTALDGGGFVVVWTSSGQDGSSEGVFGQRFAADGSAVGGEFRVNVDTSGNQSDPTVSALPGGGFVVSYYDGGRIAAQQFDADGNLLDQETRVDTHDANGSASGPAVATLANGAFVVTWTDYDYDISNYQVYQQLFANPAQAQRQANPELVDVASSVTFRENLINAVPQLIDPAVGLFDADSADFDGGVLEVNYISGYGAQDQLGLQGLDNQDQLGIRHEGNGVGEVGVAGSQVSFGGVVIGNIVADGTNGGKLTVQFNAQATVAAVEQVIEALTYANTVSNPIATRTVSIRVTDGDGGASVARTVTIHVTPETDGAVPFGLERTVNTTQGGYQYEPSITRLADGGYVVVWEDNGGADGSGYGIYGQRYDENDAAVGGEFRINTTTTGTQDEPQVQALAGGGFVVIWTSNDGNGDGVYMQRYAADGSALGGETLVNTLTTSTQYQPAVAATADGGYIVAWYHDYYSAGNTEYADVFFQRFDADGNKLGAETKANPPLGSTFLYQSQPDIAVLADGSFVITWTDGAEDGSSNGIFGQRFASDGTALGASFQVNSYNTNQQENSSVTALKDGGFLVTWQSNGQDLSSWGVYAQRYDAAGNTVGAEFRVNTTITSGQYNSEVTALENGGWVVVWYGDQSDDVFMQQYNAAGAAVDGETRVNSYTYSHQGAPAVTSMADGGFVVTWQGYKSSGDGDGDGLPDGGNNTYEIRLQRFSNTAPEISDVVVNGLEDTPLTLLNTVFEGGFNDPDGQTLQAIKIITPPAEGTLRLNGVAVVVDQEISLADLQAGLLTYQGRADYFGLDQFRWTGSDGITFASTPVFTNINLANVNDGPGLDAGADDTAAEGTYFSHNITLADPDPEGHRLTIDWGDGTAPQVVFVGNGANHNIAHYFADNGSYQVTVTADDQQGQGNSVEADSFTVTVSNVAPTLNLFGTANVLVDEPYTLTLGGVNDPGDDTVIEYRIDWGDGSPVQVVAAADLPSNRELQHTYTSTGQRDISVTLVDEDGVFADAGTRTVEVTPPAEVIVVDAGADRTVNEGTLFTQTINFTDPADQSPAGRSYTVQWGDGTTSSGSLSSGQLSFNISHVYADDGQTYSVVVTVDDSGAQQGTDSFDVTVQNVAPTLSLGGANSVAEGSVYTMTLNVNDPGDDTVTEYQINWGDGSPVQVVAAADLPANRQVTHVYADGDAPFNITVQVTDEDGVWANAGSRSVFVNNVGPTAPVSGAATVDEGALYTLTVGSVSDPGADTRNLYSIDWGDGTIQTFTVAEWAAAGGSFDHVFADGNINGTNRTIVVRATDEDGSFVLGTQQVTVANVAPELAINGAADTDEGAAYSLAIAGSDVAGAADPLSYSIDWGDGSAVQVLTAAELAALGGNVQHIFADDEDGPVNSTARTISVTVSDGDGGSTTATQNVNVHNVAPTAALSGADSVDEGSSYSLSVGTVQDPGTDTISGYSIDWGDGTVENYTVAEWTAAAGSFSHTYADGAASPTIVVSATDEDGTHVLGSKAITVANVAPELAINGAADTDEGAAYSLAIAGSDVAGAADPLSYSIDWGDGSAVQVLTAAELAALGGNVQHIFADDEDGPVNSTARTISVTVSDGDGGSTTRTQGVNVHNVAPGIALSGAANATTGVAYSLTLGAVSDPGQDTVTEYIVDWGDGTVQSYANGGEVSHVYAAAGAQTISVSLVDEDGTHVGGTVNVDVQDPSTTLSLEAGADATLNEGQSLVRNIVFSDGEDTDGDGWSYSIDYGDGTVVQGQTLVQQLALNHVYADGDAQHQVTITVTDGQGESASDSFTVTVDNVAPTAALSGADSVDEGSSYSLGVGAVQDPGADTISAYSIDWGDGNVDSFTVAEWAAAAGNFSHTYADGAASPTIVVSATDEDGTHVLGSKAITVANVAPELVINGAADTDEGAAYSLAIAGSDVAGAADPLSYSIDWGDGSAVQVLTAAELAALGGTVQHIFADDEDGPVNSTGRTISVTVSDGDGGSTTATQNVNVHNVAPDIALAGAGTATAGVAYVLNLGAVNDPGQDTVTEYIVDWGDGNVQSYASGGDVSHVYAAAGAQTISVSLVDEDGTHAGGTLNLDVEAPELTTVRIGDAPPRQGGTGGQWLEAWTDPAVLAIEHKANVADANESWTAATFAGGYFSLLSGIDIYQGDLGVSGQTQATSTVKQELDGTEALRFTLAEEATAVSVNLARFQLNDDGSLMAEAGLLRLIDANGQVVGEQAFQASGTGGQQLVQASAAQAFVAVEIWAGAYDGNDFVFGAYVAPDGSTVAPYEAGGKMHGSEFTLDWLEFSFPVVLGATDSLLQDPLGP